MRIGIDAKWIFDGPPSGKVVVTSIIEELLKLNFKHDFFLFVSKRHRNQVLPFTTSPKEVIYVPGINNALQNVFVIPVIAKSKKLDLVLFQNFSSPFGHFKSINYVHDVLYMDYPQYYSFIERIYLWPIKWLSKLADHVITISESEKQRMINHNLGGQGDISVVYHGINHREKREITIGDKRGLIEKYQIPPEFVLYVGRLNERKNIFNLLKAFTLVNDDVSLVIVGQVDHKMFDLEKTLRKFKLENRVYITGFVSDDDLPGIYQMAKMFCFPSFAEGFGLPPLEAMDAGCPVIASNTTSLPEVCGEAAILVNPNDFIQISESINSLYFDEIERNRIKKLGYLQAAKFSWNKSAQEILSIMDKIGAENDK